MDQLLPKLQTPTPLPTCFHPFVECVFTKYKIHLMKVVEDSMAITIAQTNFEFLCDMNLIIFFMHVILLETNHAIIKFSQKIISLKYDYVICQMHLYSFHSIIKYNNAFKVLFCKVVNMAL